MALPLGDGGVVRATGIEPAPLEWEYSVFAVRPCSQEPSPRTGRRGSPTPESNRPFDLTMVASFPLDERGNVLVESGGIEPPFQVCQTRVFPLDDDPRWRP